MTASLCIENGGLCTTVQDEGRMGYQSIGIPVSGALDRYALQLANALVGNPLTCAALEIRMLGPTIRIKARQVRVALSGINTKIQVLQPYCVDIPSNRSVTLTHNTVFRIKTSQDTSCCYLAVEGGFALTPVLGSHSTYLNGHLGGFQGRALRAGDHLPLQLESVSDKPEQHLARAPAQHRDVTTIRVIPGPQLDYFDAQGIDTFFSSDYSVTTQLDRMGMRLEGPEITHRNGYNIPSDGITTGAVQVPGDGKPIILLADRQTTGGYPKIGCVASADVPTLAQQTPGAIIKFQLITVDKAEQIRRNQEAAFSALLQSIAATPDCDSVNESALYSENLISGGEWLTDDE